MSFVKADSALLFSISEPSEDAHDYVESPKATRGKKTENLSTQRAVAVRRRIEDYIERKNLREHFGFELED